MTTKMNNAVDNTDEKETVPSSQIVFTSLVKKLSRRLKIWKQRILTLNSQGEIFIARVETKSQGIVLVSSSSQHQSRNRRKPPINLSEPAVLARQGKPSDIGWPKKLDMRQTLILKSDIKTYIFLPSVRAAEALRTQMRILQLRLKSEQKSGEDSRNAVPDQVSRREVKLRRTVSESIQSLPDMDTNQTNGKTSWCDDVISREGKDTELTLLTGLDRKKSFSLVSLVEFTDTIRSSLSEDSSLTENLSDDKINENSTEKEKQIETKSARGEKKVGGEKEGRGKEVEPLEVCFDFTSGPGYLACKRNSVLKDNSIISMNNLKKRDSLLFRPSTQFRPKPILKPESLYVVEKREREPRVTFNTCPSVRIISRVENGSSENVEKDYDLVSHYIYKYVVNSHKLKSDRFNARKKQA